MLFTDGSRVEVVGLEKSKRLNGKRVKIIRYSQRRQGYIVQFDVSSDKEREPECFIAKPENLGYVTTISESHVLYLHALEVCLHPV